MEKKLLKLCCLVLLAMTALAGRAQTFTSEELTFKFFGTNLYCVGLSSAGQSETHIIVPSSVTYNGTAHRVWGIDDYAFKDKTNIYSVKINFGVVYINSHAFEGCTNLGSIDLPSSLKRIDADAFKGCTALTGVYYAGFSFPQEGINATAFPNKSGMYFYIPYQSSKTPEQYKAKSEYSRFANVSYDKLAYDFYTADNGIYCIGWPDDYGPSMVRSATLTSYHSNSNSPTYRPSNPITSTFYGVPFSIDTIGANAFRGINYLTTIDLTNLSNLKYFGSQEKDMGIQNVTTLVLPPSNFNYTTISFLYFNSLTEFKLASGSTKFSIYEGCLYNYSKTTLIKVPNAKEGQMSYPSTLKTVWNWSHCNCAKITHAMLPYGVTSINSGAFANTSKLDYVRIPSSVTSLSNDRVFNGTKYNNYIYCNMDNPPTVTASSYFGDNSGMNLYIPYGKESTYSSAGWTGFKNVNSGGRQAYDYPSSTATLCYSVTNNGTVTGADGITYSGRVRLVCNGITSNDDAPTTITIPASVTIGGKEYVVNRIGDAAFNNRTTDFTVNGCVNVDTIGAFAFSGQSITSYAFTHNLRNIDQFAFYGSGLTGTIALPYGLRKLGVSSFANGKYSRIIVPSSVNSINGDFCYNTSTLTDLVLNLKNSVFYNYSGWKLDGVPSACRILVPTGVVKQYKQNSKLSSRASYINAGAYDFAYGNNHAGVYFLTVLSTTPVTFQGTTYAGKARYVYHPNIQNLTTTNTYWFSNSEADVTDPNDEREYLITEIGDSTLYGSKFTDGTIPSGVTRIGQSAFRNCEFAAHPLLLPEGLTFIGHDAFYGSKIAGEVRIPSTVTTLEEYALCTSTLNSIVFPDIPLPSMGQCVWSQSINYGVYVPNHRAPQYLTKANSWGTSYGNKLAVWINPDATTQMFSSVVPVDFSGTAVKAYYASAYNKNNTGKEVTMTQVSKIPAGTGVLLTNLQANSPQRFDRPTGSVTAPSTNYLVGTPDHAVNITNVNVGYYWVSNTNGKRFIRPTSAINSVIGKAYLKLSSSEASGKNEVYTTLFPKTSGSSIPGDVNGDGHVTSVDVTALYNWLLNNDDSDLVNGDQDGDGHVTSVDVTVVYNIMLDND